MEWLQKRPTNDQRSFIAQLFHIENVAYILAELFTFVTQWNLFMGEKSHHSVEGFKPT